jgi:hypothetical protein
VAGGYFFSIYHFNSTGIITIPTPDLEIPSEYSLSQNYPNPFNPTTVIRIRLPKTSYVNIAAFDVSGKQVSTLVEGWWQEGEHQVIFDGSKLSSGLYFCRMQAGEFTAVKKMVMVK